MADYYVTQNFDGLKAGTTVSFSEDELSEVLRRGIKGGLLVEEKPAKSKKAVKAEEVEVDGSDIDSDA